MTAEQVSTLTKNQGTLTNNLASMLSMLFVDQQVYCMGYQDFMRTTMAVVTDKELKEILLDVIKGAGIVTATAAPSTLALIPVAIVATEK